MLHPKETKITSSPRERREDKAGAIRYIKFSGKYNKFHEWKEKIKAIARHKGILQYLTKEVEIPPEDKAENDEEKMKINEGNSKACDFLIISLADILFWSGQAE